MSGGFIQKGVVIKRQCPKCGRELLCRVYIVGGKERISEGRCECEKEQLKKYDSIIFSDKSPSKIDIAKQISHIFPCDEEKRFNNFYPSNNNEYGTAKAVCDYASNFKKWFKEGRGLCLIGNVGTGKSHLSLALRSAVISQGFSCAFMKAPTMLDELREAKSFKADRSVSEYISILSSVDLLIIDDLGANEWNENAFNCLYQIVDNRYRQLKPIVINSNLSRESMKHVVKDRIYDRLAERNLFIEMKWESYRQKKKKR